jgi:hypothetical protein
MKHIITRFFIVIFFLIFIFIIPQLVIAAQIRLAWDANTERDLAGYKLFYRTDQGSFEEPIKLGKGTTITLTGLIQGQTYCFALKAYDWSRLDSDFSNQVCGIAHDVLYGKWVFDISGTDKGGAVLRFEDSQNTLRGYGITNNLDFFGIEGTYTVEEDKTISGSYKTYDFLNPESTPGNGNIGGEVDQGGTRITLELDTLSLSMKGSLFIEDPYNPQYPDIAEGWTLHITGAKKGDIDALKIEPYPLPGESYSGLFKFSGSGVTTNLESIDLVGVLFLTSKNIFGVSIYGVYEISRDLSDTGFFSGSLNRNLTRFNARSLSDNGNRYTLTGQVIP